MVIAKANRGQILSGLSRYIAHVINLKYSREKVKSALKKKSDELHARIFKIYVSQLNPEFYALRL